MGFEPVFYQDQALNCSIILFSVIYLNVFNMAQREHEHLETIRSQISKLVWSGSEFRVASQKKGLKPVGG